MLILTRRPGESLHLGDHIKITVLGVQGKQIKIGLEVPDDMQVYREEVYLRVLEQNRQALCAMIPMSWRRRSYGQKKRTNSGNAPWRLTLPEERVLQFPRGLIGFGDLRNSPSIQVRDDSPFWCCKASTTRRWGCSWPIPTRL